MTWYGFLTLFGLSCVLFSCQGDVSPPSSGDKLILLPGSNAKIDWTFDDKISDVLFRSWAFTSSYNSNDTGTLASIIRNGSTEISPSTLPSFTIQRPATLVIKNVERRHDGVYKFTVAAQLSTTDVDVTVIIVVAPTITFSCPNSSIVNEGDNFTCLCKGEGGRPTANVSWYDKSDVKIGETGKGEQSLNLTNVNETHIGNYTCKAQSHVNATDEKSIEINVRLNYKPKDTNITIKPEVAEVGSRVEITCKSDGLPEPSYAIFHNGSKVNDGGTFMIKNVNYHHNGTYKCVATNKRGNDSDSANLTVVARKSSSQQIQPSTTTQQIQLSTPRIQSQTTQRIQPSTAQPVVPTTTLEETSPDGGSDEISTGVIVGAACGGVAIMVIVAGVVIYIIYRGGDNKSDVDPNDPNGSNGSKVIVNHYEMDEDQVEGGGNTYDRAKPPDGSGEGSHNNAEHNPPESSLPPVYASVNKENRQGNTLYASLDSEALKRPSQKKPAENQPKNAPTEYASIDFMKTAKTPNDDSVST